MQTKIIIILIPIIAYCIFWFWTNRLINSKIKNTESRKKYKKAFGINLVDVFAPIFLIPVLIIMMFSFKEEYAKDGNFAIFFLVMKFLLIIPLIGIAKIKFEYVKSDLLKLKNETEIEIMADLE